MSIDIHAVVQLAREAGQLALAQLAAMSVELKADASYVTQIDRQVEAMLRERLEAAHPAAGFWGEETGSERLEARDLWVVDPIDGTTNLVNRLPVWGISIGLLRDARPYAGVLHIPSVDETYWAVAGEGAFCDGRRIAAAAPKHKWHREDAVAIGSECFAILDLHRFPGRVRNYGGTAAHIAYTGRGALVAHVGRDEKLHDLVGALCVALEAGCSVEYLCGGEVDLRAWLAGAVNAEPLLVAAPGTLPLLRATLLRRQAG
jgi:fructose-1,6-bisphosphatase/inositol monophosphatase family enzyme